MLVYTQSKKYRKEASTKLTVNFSLALEELGDGAAELGLLEGGPVGLGGDHGDDGEEDGGGLHGDGGVRDYLRLPALILILSYHQDRSSQGSRAYFSWCVICPF